MRRLGVCLAFSALAITPALAQKTNGVDEAERRLDDLAEDESGGKSKVGVKLQMSSGLDDDDDLLDPDLDVDAAPAHPKADENEPPLAEKTRIDNTAIEIGRAADQFGDELRDLVRALRQKQANADEQIKKRLAEAESQLSGLHTQIAELEKKIEKTQGRRRRELASYGTPLDFDRLPRRASNGRFRGQRGDEQFTWWQKLVIKSLDGLQGSVKKLAESRANSLKARADALALGTELEYRGYADAAVRESVGSSRFAQPVYDARLNDLMLGNGAKTGALARASKGTAEPKPTTPEINPAYLSTNEPVVLLPRTRNPETGRLVPIVNMELGGPFGGGASVDPTSDTTPEQVQPAVPPAPNGTPGSTSITPTR